MNSADNAGVGSRDVYTLSDEVLRKTVTRINRTHRRTREAQATEASTKLYLQAGVHLIIKEFSPEARENEDGDETTPPYVAWLSRARVVDEAKKLALEPGRGGTPTADQLRDKWEPHRNYLADLLGVAMALEFDWVGGTQSGALADEGIDIQDLTSLIHEVAYRDLKQLIESPTYRIILLAAVIAQREPDIQLALEDTYHSATATWIELYESLMTAMGFRLRQGITMSDFAVMLGAASEGLAVRKLGDPAAHVIDHEKRRSMLGTIVIAMAAACFERADSAESITVEEFLLKSLG
jgi:hypothetical protein